MKLKLIYQDNDVVCAVPEGEGKGDPDTLVLNRTPVLKGDTEKGEITSRSSESSFEEEDILQAAVFALTALFRSALLVLTGVIGVVDGLAKKLLNKNSVNSISGILRLCWGSLNGKDFG